MKKVFFILSAFAIAASSRAQSSFPWTRVNSPTDGSYFSSAPATVRVIGEAFAPGGYNLTNLSLFSNGSLIVSQSGPSTTITADLPSLAAGSYILYTVARGIGTLPRNNGQEWAVISAQVNITVGPVGPTYGTIDFMNRNIPTSQPNSALPGYIPGGNGNGTYNVPIYQGDGTSPGAGLLPGGVTVGLFEAGATIPLVTTQLRTDTPANARFFSTSVQTATTSSPVGSTPTLYIRAWTTASGSYEAARWSPGGMYREWQFTPQPLGGRLPDGSTIPTPSVTGWGALDGSGVSMVYPVFSVFGRINSPISGSVFTSPANVTVIGEVIIPIESYFVLTNLSLFVNDTLLGSQSGSARLITAHTSPLAPGSYRLTVVSDGYSTTNAGRALSQTNYVPVNFQVVTPLEISVTPAQIVSGEFQFNYAANPGLKYVVKSSSDLFDWQPIVTNTPTANPAIFSEPFNSALKRYYQVERLPNP